MAVIYFVRSIYTLWQMSHSGNFGKATCASYYCMCSNTCAGINIRVQWPPVNGSTLLQNQPKTFHKRIMKIFWFIWKYSSCETHSNRLSSWQWLLPWFNTNCHRHIVFVVLSLPLEIDCSAKRHMRCHCLTLTYRFIWWYYLCYAVYFKTLADAASRTVISITLSVHKML
jgi:hypothetical protein